MQEFDLTLPFSHSVFKHSVVRFDPTLMSESVSSSELKASMMSSSEEIVKLSTVGEQIVEAMVG